MADSVNAISRQTFYVTTCRGDRLTVRRPDNVLLWEAFAEEKRYVIIEPTPLA